MRVSRGDGARVALAGGFAALSPNHPSCFLHLGPSDESTSAALVRPMPIPFSSEG